jgi:hypothetical protein
MTLTSTVGTMKAAIGHHFDEMQGLLRKVPGNRIPSEKLADEFLAAMKKVFALLFENNPSSTPPLGDAYAKLSGKIKEYRHDPEPKRITGIGRALNAWRRAITPG